MADTDFEDDFEFPDEKEEKAAKKAADDKFEIELASQTFDNNLQVKHSEETTSKPSPE